MGRRRCKPFWARAFTRRGEGGITEVTQAIDASGLQHGRSGILETSLHSSWLSDPIQGSCGRAGFPSRCGCAGLKHRVTGRRRLGYREVPWGQYRFFKGAPSKLLQKKGGENPYMCLGQGWSLSRRIIR